MPVDCQADRYREMEIQTASPVELVALLYDAAIASLQKARAHLASRNIEKRTRCLNEASAILTELQANLDFEQGSDIAISLDRLYGYMKGRILQANLLQDAAPLTEVVNLLDDLRAAWVEVAQKLAQPGLQPATEIQPPSSPVTLPVAASSRKLSPLAGINVTG